MPYENTGLGAYIPIVNKYIVSNSYFEKLNSDDLPIFINILKQNSVQHELLVEKISCKDNQLLKDKYSSSYYSTQVDIDFSIKKLEYLIANISESIARLIWNACKKGCENHYYDITRGTFKLNQQHQKYFAISQLVQKLKDARWIPTKIGEFKKPCDVLRDEMPDDFCLDLKHCNEKYEKFLKEIGFEKNREYGEGGKEEPDEIDKLTQRMCELFGVSRLTREDLERYIRTLREEKVQPDFPIKVVNNPFRRSQKIKEEYMNARSKQYKEIKRSIRVSDGDIKPKHYLNDNYKNDDSEVICQICEQEMPFKKNGGEHYFECVEIFDKDSFSKEHQAMYLALCPSCAAKYKRYVKEAVNKSVRLFNILTQIEEFDFNSSQDFIIKISLDEEGTVRFTEQHLRDVQTLVKEDM